MAHELSGTRNWTGQKIVVKTLAQSVFFLAVVALAVRTILSLIAPVSFTMTTRYPVPYLPANYTLVEKVTNKFVDTVSWGGAGGLGAPQVDMGLDTYKELESPSAQYLALEHTKRTTTLHYYDLQPARVTHTTATFLAALAFSNTGMEVGTYQGWSGKILGNELVVQGGYEMSHLATLSLGILLISFVALWILGSGLINSFINKVYSHR